MTLKRLSAVLAAGSLCWAGSASAALTGFWQFEESTTATTTFDSVTNTESGTFPTGTTIATGGTEATALSHANTGALESFVDTNVTGATLGITGAGNKTMIAWIKANNTGDWDTGDRHGIISYGPDSGGSAGGDLRLVLDENAGGLRFEVSFGFVAHNATSLDDGGWHMVAVVIEAGDAVHDVQLYVDGSFVSIDSQSGANTAIDTASDTSEAPPGLGNLDFVIGGDHRTDNVGDGINAFLGQIDQVRIYDEALDEAALDAIFNIPEPGSLALLGLGALCLLGRRSV